ncbi:tetratricopeptide repeat protein 33 isoform X2 [Hydra vulgaris]|uniref:Tetratricopeptide repeat protein 33 isoform X2 n=1 Tax=Hydra vulgaris TaxID=6087 RepID=A0ABM4BM42_HYDVU
MLLWKRKVPTLRSLEIFSRAKYDRDNDDDANGDNDNDEPKRKNICIESINKKNIDENVDDKALRSNQCVKKGIVLAETGRYWESLHYFDEAILCTPNDAKIYEMKAQALLELRELYPALEVAEKAVKINTQWAEGFQTLGRCQISCGEIKQALKNFCKAFHLNPILDELYEEDIKWAQQLLLQQQQLVQQNQVKQPCNNCRPSKEVETSILYNFE